MNHLREKISCRTAIICTTAFLTCLGLLAIYASSSIPATLQSGSEFTYLKKQALVAAIGFFVIFFAGHIPFKWIERINLPLLLITIIGLIAVQIPALQGQAKGAARWVLVGGISIQPGEIAKLALVLFLAKNLARSKTNLESFYRGVLPNLAVLALLIALLLVQPDFGSAVVLTCITATMLFVAGLPRRFIISLSLAGLCAIMAAIVLEPYRLKRILAFINPWTQIKHGGFQIIQSYLGFQNGGFFGVGLGESRQKLFFLPEAHTDFILAVIGEELGLLGVVLICGLFLYLIYLGFRVAIDQVSPYRKFLAFGITMLIAIQSAINLGVTMGLLPTKGLTLPFLSNGANSLLVFLLAIAILARISQEEPSN